MPTPSRKLLGVLRVACPPLVANVWGVVRVGYPPLVANVLGVVWCVVGGVPTPSRKCVGCLEGGVPMFSRKGTYLVYRTRTPPTVETPGEVLVRYTYLRSRQQKTVLPPRHKNLSNQQRSH